MDPSSREDDGYPEGPDLVQLMLRGRNQESMGCGHVQKVETVP